METEKSIDSVRSSIERKIRGPYLANNKTVLNSVTDQDHHPYTRYFRGVYYFPDPIVMEREAGWRPIHNNCYDMVIPRQPETNPHHCYEAPCTTTFPCYPQYLTKYADKNALDVMINNACVVQYR